MLATIRQLPEQRTPLDFLRWDMYQRTLRYSPNDYYAEASKYWLRTVGEAANPAP
jgi:hypothetical protein